MKTIKLIAVFVMCFVVGTAWAADTQEKTVRIGFTIKNKQEKSIRIGFKLIHNYTISYDLGGVRVTTQ